jgi:hypothetical protein
MKIQNYVEDNTISLNDKLIGTDSEGNNTRNYTLESISDLFGVTPKYKVFTALLTQSGGGDTQYINWDDDPNTLTVGVTYTITSNDDNSNFIPNGAPDNNVGTSFIATSSVVAWGTDNTGDNQVSYNGGAPVATVLENTIGNIWFIYTGVGLYSVESNGLFTVDKSFSLIGTPSEGVQNNNFAGVNFESDSKFIIYVVEGDSIDDLLSKTPIEIRVYN